MYHCVSSQAELEDIFTQILGQREVLAERARYLSFETQGVTLENAVHEHRTQLSPTRHVQLSDTITYPSQDYYRSAGLKISQKYFLMWPLPIIGCGDGIQIHM
jgi:hypothetical protein